MVPGLNGNLFKLPKRPIPFGNFGNFNSNKNVI